MKYIIVKSFDLRSVEEEVSRHLKNGGKLHGSPSITARGYSVASEFLYTQAMVWDKK